MRDLTKASGMVLSASPYGEYDKRLTVLTREVGKITVFAHGARRMNSPFLAAANPFVYGEFSLIEGRSAYTLVSVADAEYFEGLSAMSPEVYYGFYFLELASYYSQENLEAGSTVNLLYTTIRALMRRVVPVKLIRSIYECRIMSVNGDFACPAEQGNLSDAAYYALDFVPKCPLMKLYSFRLSEKACQEFSGVVSKRLKELTGNRFKSLSVLGTIDAPNSVDYNL